jgi:hypothetical protein
LVLSKEVLAAYQWEAMSLTSWKAMLICSVNFVFYCDVNYSKRIETKTKVRRIKRDEVMTSVSTVDEVMRLNVCQYVHLLD